MTRATKLFVWRQAELMEVVKGVFKENPEARGRQWVKIYETPMVYKAQNHQNRLKSLRLWSRDEGFVLVRRHRTLLVTMLDEEGKVYTSDGEILRARGPRVEGPR